MRTSRVGLGAAADNLSLLYTHSLQPLPLTYPQVVLRVKLVGLCAGVGDVAGLV